MLQKIAIGVLKIIIYLAFVGLAVYYTPKILSHYLKTPYPLATITSGSMWPQLKVNDLILMKGISGEEAKVGQIIIYKNAQGFTIHRLIRRQGSMLITKGDANNSEDAPVNPKDVVGRMVYIKDKPFRIPFFGVIARSLGPKLQNIEK